MALLTPWRKKEQVEVIETSDQAFKQAVGALAKAIYEDEKLAKGFLNGNAAQMPGTSWSNQGTINNALVARVSQQLASSFGKAPEELEAALAENGLSWGPPFPPGRPLDPFWGYKRPPRTWDYSVGENVQLTPRWNRISFPTLKAIIESYYAAQICVRHLINDVRSLDYQFIPPQNVLEDATEDLAKAEQFFNSPDKRQPFRAWLAEYLQDVLRYDAGALYIRRNEGGEPIALEVVSGSTIIPLIDFFGRPPVDEDDANATPEGLFEGDIVPAYLQIIEGLPWVWLVKEDLIYQPLNPLPESQYGLAPMEAVLLQANTDIRFQWHFLQYFTEGSIPAGFMEAPPDLSDPIQVQEWQETWDAVMLGDQAKLRQVRWVPAGAQFTPVKNNDFQSDFPLYLMRCTAAAFGVTPNDLGFTEDVNRSTGEVQVDVQFRIGTLPIVRHLEDVINLFISEHLGLQARIAFDTGQGTQHRLESAQADDIYIKSGVLSPDEVRIRLGKRISRERPTPRFIDNNRNGPIPLLAVESLSGKIDATTYGPDQSQVLLDHPFIPAPGAAPVAGSAQAREALNAASNMQDNMLIQNNDEQAPKSSRHSVHMMQDIAEAAGPEESDAVKEAFEIIDLLLDRLAEKDGMIGGVDNTGGPGVTRGFSGTAGIIASTGAQGVDLIGRKKKKKAKKEDGGKTPPAGVRSAAKRAVQWIEEGHAGQGFTSVGRGRASDLASGKTISQAVMKRMKAYFDRHQVDKNAEGFHQGEKGYPSPGRVAWDAWGGDAGYSWVKREIGDDPAEKSLLTIRQWRENSINRVKKGLPPRKFEDLSDFISEPIWNRLQGATTKEEVVAAFAGDILGQVDYSGRIITPPGLNLQFGDSVRLEVVEKGKEKPNPRLGRRAAGIAVQARDTGRVVMIQRTPDKHDDDDASARWEWPGGKLDGGGDGRIDESVWAGALREWHEETGAVMPLDAEIVGGWLSEDGDYEGFVVKIDKEDEITFDPQPEETAAAGWWHPDDLDDDDIRQKVHDQLGSIQPLLEGETE